MFDAVVPNFYVCAIERFLRNDGEKIAIEGVKRPSILYKKAAYKRAIHRFLLRSSEGKTGRKRSEGIFGSLAFLDHYLIS